MPLSVVYINVDGQPMSEIRGGVVTEYVHDPLGNLIATHNSAGVVTWTGEYWPYGETMISSGTKVNNWGFCAAWGYYDDGYDNSYVRRRVLRRKLARWQTVDPTWPREKGFEYAWCNPVEWADPSGTVPCSGNPCAEIKPVSYGGCVSLYCSVAASAEFYKFLRGLFELRPRLEIDFLNELREILEQKDPFTRAEDCCKRFLIKDKPSPLETIIHGLCKTKRLSQFSCVEKSLRHWLENPDLTLHNIDTYCNETCCAGYKDQKQHGLCQKICHSYFGQQ